MAKLLRLVFLQEGRLQRLLHPVSAEALPKIEFLQEVMRYIGHPYAIIPRQVQERSNCLIDSSLVSSCLSFAQELARIGEATRLPESFTDMTENALEVVETAGGLSRESFGEPRGLDVDCTFDLPSSRLHTQDLSFELKQIIQLEKATISQNPEMGIRAIIPIQEEIESIIEDIEDSFAEKLAKALMQADSIEEIRQAYTCNEREIKYFLRGECAERFVKKVQQEIKQSGSPPAQRYKGSNNLLTLVLFHDMKWSAEIEGGGF